MTSRKPTLGDQELALLRYVAEHEPVSAGEVSANYGEPSGLARSTVETVLERLRKKGYITRAKSEGSFRYKTAVPTHELVGGLVDQFVQKTLGGSLTPLVTYFSKQDDLSADELAQLEQLVEKLRKGREAAR